jgi:hypothetical protein
MLSHAKAEKKPGNTFVDGEKIREKEKRPDAPSLSQILFVFLLLFC